MPPSMSRDVSSVYSIESMTGSGQFESCITPPPPITTLIHNSLLRANSTTRSKRECYVPSRNKQVQDEKISAHPATCEGHPSSIMLPRLASEKSVSTDNEKNSLNEKRKPSSFFSRIISRYKNIGLKNSISDRKSSSFNGEDGWGHFIDLEE
uniref:Uncharacterized protein n=1 Tax=Proboscia inermis TaxID=420281 RepID=A0A7S0GAL1_9STRA|mmetsp:Transcript_18870/g.19116  ORF Transcript_18870/g.19116 Transcript_18870/m.19116 type:complete len:152 (+) Transcript_18870:72-527(+)